MKHATTHTAAKHTAVNNRLQNNSQWFTLFLAVLVLTLSMNILAGGKDPIAPADVYYSTNSDAVNPGMTKVQPVTSQKSAQQKELEAKLDMARLSGNTMSAKQLQSELDALLGITQYLQQDAGFPYVDKTTNPEPLTDYNQTSIHELSIYSHAFGTAPSNSPIAGRLFYVITQSASANMADTLKIMQSTDNGTTWSSIHILGINGYEINKDELDIEIVHDGTTTWIFGVVGFTDPNTNKKSSYFFRKNAMASGFYGTMLSFPGNTTGMHYYNPRITSDNANFSSNSYVMVLCSMDSIVSGSRFIKQKYMLCTSPFDATPGMTYPQPNGHQGFGWHATMGTNLNSYLYGDIAYYKDDGGTGNNRVIAVYGNPAANDNIYITYLDGYTSNPNNMIIAEFTPNKHLKIAFNGGSNNRNGMITYVRKFNDTDWDVFALKTTNGGSNASGWTRDTVDYSDDFSRSCDLVAVRGGANQFKVAYAMDDNSQAGAFYRSYNGSWTSSFKFSHTKADTTYAKPRAGYLLGGGDDGAGVWSLHNGYHGFFSKNMITTTGISNNNEIPEGFSLSQNYPNPFNPVTNIKFSIPKAGLVTLKVYDITGKEVASLVNQNMNAGSYTFDFDASYLSSGAYFYRINTDGFTDVKKMMLIK
jgi:hypothetical protein